MKAADVVPQMSPSCGDDGLVSLCPVQKIVTSTTFNTPSHPDFKGSIKICFYLPFSNMNSFHVFIYCLCHHKVILEVVNRQRLLFALCPLLP